jgi:hypothetical protein
MRNPELNQATKIPPEIWLKIFSYATFIPGAFAILDRSAINAFAKDRYGLTLHNRFSAAMQFSLAVSLVSKAWNSLIQETMFQYVLIKSGDQVVRLAEALDQRKISFENAPVPTWWTLRLEISLHGVHIWTKAHANALFKIIKNCPNLVIFSTAFCTATAYSFYATLFHVLRDIRAHSRLRRLELKGDAESLEQATVMFSSSLEVLFVIPSRTANIVANIMAKPSSCRLPKLHTLISTFGFGSGFTRKWDMPCLQAFRTDDPSELDFCLRRVGHNLTHLSIPSGALVAPSLSYCANLQELAIDFCSSSDFINGLLLKKPFPTLASIYCIVLQNLKFSHPTCQHRNPAVCDLAYYLRSTLSSISSEASFPSLERIRLLLPLQCESFECDRHFKWSLRTWLHSCLARGVQVQYCQGANDWTADANWQPFTVDFVESSL